MSIRTSRFEIYGFNVCNIFTYIPTYTHTYIRQDFMHSTVQNLVKVKIGCGISHINAYKYNTYKIKLL